MIPNNLNYARKNISCPAVQYLKQDDVCIAFQCFGEGANTLIIASGFISHLKYHWENIELREFLIKLSQKIRVVLFDCRGSGMSDRIAKPVTLQQYANDIKNLMVEINCTKASIMGLSEGGPTAIQFSVSYPELIDKLILYGTSAVWMNSEEHSTTVASSAFNYKKNTIVTNWGDDLSIKQFAPTKANSISDALWWEKCIKFSSFPCNTKNVLNNLKKTDASSMLGIIKASTLIMHKLGDKVVHVEASDALQEAIPDAYSFKINGDDHWIWTEKVRFILGFIIDHIE